MASQSNQDWQSTKNTVLERNSHMFNSPFMSDIEFTCGESKRKRFYAHKYVLATSSAVFYAMLYGDLAEKISVLHLPDTDEESFEEFLRFLYTDQCTLTLDIAMKVMYLAKKYIIPSLTEKCVQFIPSRLKPENVATVLDQAIQFDDKEMENKCWKVVETQTSKTVTSNAFINISQKTLCNLLKRDTMNIKEIHLFGAVLKWCDNQCRKTGSEPNGENRRALLGDAIYQIRFLSMTQKQFAQNVSSSGLLQHEEITPIYEKFNGVENPNLKWTQPKRKPAPPAYLQYIARFSKDNVITLSWNYTNGVSDRLSFIASQSVTFYGVQLFGDANGSTYDVSLEVNTVNVSGRYKSELKTEGIFGFDVMLPSPTVVQQNSLVEIVASIKGPTSYSGRNGNHEVRVKGTTITFRSVSGPSNGTSISSGQFYQIIISTQDFEGACISDRLQQCCS